MDQLFDENKMADQARQLAAQSQAAGPLPLAEARAKAREDILVAGVLLGMEDLLPEQCFGNCVGLSDRVAFRLSDAQEARALLRAALHGALGFTAGEEGRDADGYLTEQDSATCAHLMLGFSSLLSDATASSQYLAGLPPDKPEGKS